MKRQIHANHNVYILGAGFSVDAGLPVMSAFLDRMRSSIDWQTQESRKKERDAIERVFDFRLQAAAAAYRTNINVENIEELFSLASASESDTSGDHIITVEDISTAIAATLEYSEAVVHRPPHCILHLPLQKVAYSPPHWEMKASSFTQKQQATVPLYDIYAGILSGALCQGSPDQRNTVITFNYDTLLENALHNQQITFMYGITPSPTQEVVFDESAKCVSAFESASESLPVLKLHGSVNWGTANRHPNTLQVFGNYSDVRNADSYPVLIPPTWRKVFGGALNQVWGQARQAISEAARIIVIGFSVPPTDTHFKYLLAAGLRNNVSLRNIYFINPSSDLRDSVFTIFRPELEALGLIHIQPTLTVDDSFRASTTSSLLYTGAQRLINRSLAEGYILETLSDSRGKKFHIGDSIEGNWRDF